MIPIYLDPAPTFKEHIRRMKEILSSPFHWTKKTFAQTRGAFWGLGKSHDVNYMSNEAYSFCLLGAHRRAGNGYDHRNKLEHMLSRYLKYTCSDIIVFNDGPSTSFKDIKDFLDYADKHA